MSRYGRRRSHNATHKPPLQRGDPTEHPAVPHLLLVGGPARRNRAYHPVGDHDLGLFGGPPSVPQEKEE